MKHPASYVIRQLMLDSALAVWSDDTTTSWKVFQGFMPEEPSNAFCVYDTTAVPDGRLMRGGAVITHLGAQVKVRGLDYIEAYRKLEAVRLSLCLVARRLVVVEDVQYMLHNASVKGDIIPLGLELGTSTRRWLFTLNLICTISPAPEIGLQAELNQVTT